MSDWLADYLEWKADHPELEQGQQDVNDDLDALFRRLRAPAANPTTEK